MVFLQQGSVKMINKLKIICKKYIYSYDWFINFTKKKLPIDNQGFNQLNIFFNHREDLKSRILTVSYFKISSIYQQNIYYSTFDWLVSAKNIGGAESLYFSKNQIKIWIADKNTKKKTFWDTGLPAKRLINLIYSYDFFAISSSEKEKDQFERIIFKHYLINDIYIKHLPIEKISIENLKAGLLLKLIYKEKIKETINLIKRIIHSNIDKHGFHKSYNPISQAEYINNLIEIKNILLFYKADSIFELDLQIVNMSSVLNSLFHKDLSLVLFNGSHDMYNKNIFKLIKQCENMKINKLFKIRNGLSIYSDKEKSVFFDVIKPENKFINQNLHSGTLSFELSSKKEKIITNCGSINKVYGNKPDYLRYSAAHSTIILNNTNISELDNKKSYRRIPKQIAYNYDDKDTEVILTCSHDGYKENLKKIVKRKLTISKKQNYIFGQDTIMPIKLNSKKVLYNIRFHLMPHCQSSLTNSKRKVIIKTKKRNTWVFESSNELSIQDSIVIGEDNKILQNKQIVINGFAKNSIINENWSLKEVVYEK